MRSQDNAIETIICGGTAGLVSRFFIAPLDVLKIRLQLQTSPFGTPPAAVLPLASQSHTPRLYHGIVHGFQTIIKQEGVRGLWKGNASAEVLYVSYAASQFMAYKYALATCAFIMPSFTGTTPPATHAFVSGACAGCFATAITYPFDLLRTRFAAQDGESRLYYSIAGAVRQITKGEGVRGLYRGLNASLIQIMPYMGLLFGIYEPCRQGIDTLLQSPSAQSLGIRNGMGWDSAIAGVLAGTWAKTAVFPLDVVRKRLQVQGPSREAYIIKGIPVYTSTLSGLTSILSREGFRGLYRGLGVSLLKSAPSSAITLWTYDQTSRLLHRLEKSWQVSD
ncbi:mitochondrial thiamine pyrophosphate carrier [Protomyces lactucae-debilis]|uniref:Mitochondrial thiamine pyrophosphate carrier n=1 Tax=Protomyces lactucae-debilis TaxID=2754530 RepID=A0A1Y2FDX0_PROLT|nr:mitochondrial thiamine pyrophosphate carrier [Protomyces lactucae-debilis]ORY82119.1 mitochondrial thiamine pyrophosphate carrier [Protomyces lactucae-debilis]